jgi:hypothetical protein
MGPCASEVLAAAGGDINNVATYCDPTMTPPDNSCFHATKLAKCTADKCKDMCPNVKTTCP